MQTMASREFNRHSGKAKQVAQTAPVIVTKWGEPEFVLMTYAEYLKLTGQTQETEKAV
ncbi:type II toxin-antitoxin system prevent-host-death family antitoxin [Uruburuella testudinis]|uniref:Type II toxin-antitoxin system prevent-host-death family antitoxin n=1 Tax=Uruburuella testudinis TaxID=1282863 RepID=A0ABY4DT65_9NEIS|nr:type II toxin-antitoxin system prevent-host-death family antitoxin [Uruburuella testudinis]UOO81613.1 type II toxin-antitoxin system prevent-host-death family antitoxin [Uruburuella testudinis]